MYCSTSQIRESLNISTVDDEGLLARLAESASGWIDRHCYLPTAGFQPSATTRYYSVENLEGGELVLDAPLLSLTSVVNGISASIPTGSIRLFPLNGERKWRLHLLGSSYDWALASEEDRVAVQGKFGWSLTCPLPVAEACIMLSCWMYKRYQAALQDNSVSQELGTVIYGASMPKQVAEILRNYRLGRQIL